MSALYANSGAAERSSATPARSARASADTRISSVCAPASSASARWRRDALRPRAARAFFGAEQRDEPVRWRPKRSQRVELFQREPAAAHRARDDQRAFELTALLQRQHAQRIQRDQRIDQRPQRRLAHVLRFELRAQDHLPRSLAQRAQQLGGQRPRVGVRVAGGVGAQPAHRIERVQQRLGRRIAGCIARARERRARHALEIARVAELGVRAFERAQHAAPAGASHTCARSCSARCNAEAASSAPRPRRRARADRPATAAAAARTRRRRATARAAPAARCGSPARRSSAGSDRPDACDSNTSAHATSAARAAQRRRARAHARSSHATHNAERDARRRHEPCDRPRVRRQRFGRAAAPPQPVRSAERERPARAWRRRAARR